MKEHHATTVLSPQTTVATDTKRMIQKTSGHVLPSDEAVQNFPEKGMSTLSSTRLENLQQIKQH
jgi:hypothetical protein